RQRHASGQRQCGYVAGRRWLGRGFIHRPLYSRWQGERAAADHRRSFGRDGHPVRRIAQLVTELYRDAGDVGRQFRRRCVDGYRRRADQLRATRRWEHFQGTAFRDRRQWLDAGHQLLNWIGESLRSGGQPAMSWTEITARRVEERLRFQSGLRRPDCEGQIMVLWHSALEPCRELHHAELSKQEL